MTARAPVAVTTVSWRSAADAVTIAAIDRLSIAYVLVTAIVLAWRQPHGLPLSVIAVHGLLFVLAAAMPMIRRTGGIGRWLGEWYPLLMVPALYTAVGLVNASDGRTHDVLVQRWEQTVFSFQPSYAWIRASEFTWLSWLLHLGYVAYYPIVAGTVLALALSGRRDAARRTIATLTATFYACYVAFLAFPVAGPRYAFPSPATAAAHTAIARLIAHVLDTFAAWGTAFPSSHVAVTAATTIAGVREWRRLGLVIAAPAVLLTLGTVYGQFHYAVDALAGLVIGGAVALTAPHGSER